MTRDEIIAMEAGQDLDFLISEKVLNLSVDEWNTRFFRNQTHYSTDIAAAWQVVVLRGQHWQVTRNGPKYNVILSWYTETGRIRVHAKAESAPLAICRAALLAVMEQSALI